MAQVPAKDRPRWREATIHASVYWPVVSLFRTRDRDNVVGMLKSTIDGLKDAGIIYDDQNLHWLEPHQAAAVGQPRVRLSLWEGHVTE